MSIEQIVVFRAALRSKAADDVVVAILGQASELQTVVESGFGIA